MYVGRTQCLPLLIWVMSTLASLGPLSFCLGKSKKIQLRIRWDSDSPSSLLAPFSFPSAPVDKGYRRGKGLCTQFTAVWLSHSHVNKSTLAKFLGIFPTS